MSRTQEELFADAKEILLELNRLDVAVFLSVLDYSGKGLSDEILVLSAEPPMNLDDLPIEHQWLDAQRSFVFEVSNRTHRHQIGWLPVEEEPVVA